MRCLTPLLALLCAPALGAGLLNDTGVTQCFDGAGLAACTQANTSDTAPYPRQDARFGRDAAAATGALSKIGGGAGGFDFTALDAAGAAIPLSGGVPTATPVCVRDNVTRLIWEVKTAANMGGTYHVDDGAPVMDGHWTRHQDALQSGGGLCAYASGWRLPTRRELLSIVHRDRIGPVVNTDFFPNTQFDIAYWTSDYAADGTGLRRWRVSFHDGTTDFQFVGSLYRVLLVRDAD